MSRLAVIVVDAVELSILERLMGAGHLPHFQQLADRSARLKMTSPLPYRSEMVWTRFLTGQDSDTLRYWSQVKFDPATYEAWSIGANESPPFFSRFMPGKRIIAFDLIHSSLHDVNGVHVTAWGAHSPQFHRASRPEGLLAQIDRRFGSNPAFNNDFEIGWFEPDYINNLTDAAIIGAQRRTDIVKWLMDRDPDWDFLVTCISEVHSGGHHFWHGMDEEHPLHGRVETSDLAGERMLDLFKAVDESVGQLIAALPADATVMVCALHGMKPADDVVSTAALPELLARHQLGRSFLKDPDQGEWKSKGFPPIVPPRNSSWYALMRRRFTAGPVDRIRHLVEAAPGPIRNLVRTLAGKGKERPLGPLYAVSPPEEAVLGPVTEVKRKANMCVVDWYQRWWPQMRWFATPTFADGHIRLNLKGRERDGIISPDQFIQTRDEIIGFLMQCTDPRTGKPAVTEVLPVHSNDPTDDAGPDADLIVIFADALDSLEHPDVGIVGPYPHVRTGSHSNLGWAMVAGPGIEHGDLGTTETRNLTATVLDLAGCLVPPSVGGSSLKDALCGMKAQAKEFALETAPKA